MARHFQEQIEVSTRGQDLYEVTGDVARVVDRAQVSVGLLTLFCRHTSASLTIQENADPDVCRDLTTFFSRLVSEDPRAYRHTAEGPDDMPAHIRSALTDVSLTIPVTAGKLALGTWQGIYLFEHRTAPHHRRIIAHVMGE